MLNNTATFTVLNGLVGANSYVPPVLTRVILVPVPQQAVDSIERARVDIYCGRNAQAVADIREAREQLRRSHASVPVATFLALDEASWFTRRDEHVLAEQSLDQILDQFAASRGLR